MLRSLTLTDLKLGLDDLLTTRRATLRGSATARLYLARLERARDEIAALPAAAAGGAPLADELATTDEQHDGYGTAIWHLAQAYLALPGASDELRASATRVLEAFVPTLGELRAPFATEASRAHEREPLLRSLRHELERFPVAPHATLAAWARGFIAQGKALDALLSDRARTEADAGKRTGAATLRTRTLGLLSRFRDALGDEIHEDASLPRDLDAQAFGYIDQLARAHHTTSVSHPSPSPSTPAPGAGSAGTPTPGTSR